MPLLLLHGGYLELILALFICLVVPVAVICLLIVLLIRHLDKKRRVRK